MIEKLGGCKLQIDGDSYSTRLYVGSISYSSTADSIYTYFKRFGTVLSVRLVIDRMTGRSKGFCFVDMLDIVGATRAIDGSRNVEIDGRSIIVNIARPLEDELTVRRNFGVDKIKKAKLCFL